ncbi:hypothetical protein [Vibrio quintilis]|uniref:Uncharacterized protein n=1 Tax=Vibrio quintilis TaxID=1117707 RepID=A0A1M7Z141_9VIBR|nr:hypothetical protein [Vibrio quintilis]SHO58522.1 hypothetical protein VQ7734_04294 [Vibrio quintilis]
MLIVMTVGLLMCHLQFELLVEFLEWFEIWGAMQYYNEVREDGSFGEQICYLSFSTEYVSHVRDDLHFLIKFIFMLPYARFGIFTEAGH